MKIYMLKETPITDTDAYRSLSLNGEETKLFMINTKSSVPTSLVRLYLLKIYQALNKKGLL